MTKRFAGSNLVGVDNGPGSAREQIAILEELLQTEVPSLTDGMAAIDRRASHGSNRVRRSDHRINRNRRRETEITLTTSVLIVLVTLVLAGLVACGVLPPDVFVRAIDVFK